MIVTLPYIWCMKPGMMYTNESRVVSSNITCHHSLQAWEISGGKLGTLTSYRHTRAILLNFETLDPQVVGQQAALDIHMHLLSLVFVTEMVIAINLSIQSKMVKRSITTQTLAYFQIKTASFIKISLYPSKNGNCWSNFCSLICQLMKFQSYTHFNNGYTFQEGNFDRSVQFTTTTR